MKGLKKAFNAIFDANDIGDDGYEVVIDDLTISYEAVVDCCSYEERCECIADCTVTFKLKGVKEPATVSFKEDDCEYFDVYMPYKLRNTNASVALTKFIKFYFGAQVIDMGCAYGSPSFKGNLSETMKTELTKIIESKIRNHTLKIGVFQTFECTIGWGSRPINIETHEREPNKLGRVDFLT